MTQQSVSVAEPLPEMQPSRPLNGNGAGAREAFEHTVQRESTLEVGTEQEIWAWAWLLWQRRRALAQSLLWGLAVAAMTAFIVPKRYQSTTRLMPPDGQSSSGLAMLAAMAGKGTLGSSSLAGGLLGQRSSGALFVDILRGRTVEDRIVAAFDLRKVYGKRYWVDARKKLTANTEIEEDRKSDVITIRVTDRDPHRAAAMAQAYVEELDHQVAEVSTSSARRERIFIGERLKSVKHDLDEASRQFSEFASANATLDLGTQGKAMVEAAARLQGELIASQSEIEGLEQIYTVDNVRVRSLRARVDELSRQLQKLGGSANRELPGQTTDAVASGFPSIRELPLVGVRWADLYRQTKIEETVYELLTQQYELAKIEEAKAIPTVKVLDAADVPEKKSFPPRALIVALGGLFSICGAAAWVVGNEVWNAQSERDPRKRLARSIADSVIASKPLRWFRRQVDLRRKNEEGAAVI